MRNAFAPIVRARPCPIFGRPVRLRGGPHWLQPDTSPHALRIPDRSGHPALRDASSWLQVRLGCVRLSPSCPFRLLHTRLLSRPARHYPRFRIQRSSSERRGDFNPHDSRAAQRTLRTSPPPHAAPGLSLAGVRLIIPDHAMGLPVLRTLSLCTCLRQYPGVATERRLRSPHPAVSAFPDMAVGSACTSSFSRLARRLLALRPAHSRRHLYVTRYTEGFSHFVTSMT